MIDFFKRLDDAGLTLPIAATLDDDTLLREPTIGRKTLRFIRAYNGPFLPPPESYVKPRSPFVAPREEDFMDADGYMDWEAYDMAWDEYVDRTDYGPHNDIPDLRESWCGEPKQEPYEDSIAFLLHKLLGA